MENETNLKKGDKLYSRTYWDDGTANWNTYTILYIKRGRIKFKGGYGWTISIKDIGDGYFTTKKALILDHLQINREGLKEKEDEYKDEITGITKEIKLLERALKKLDREKPPIHSPTLKGGVSLGAD